MDRDREVDAVEAARRVPELLRDGADALYKLGGAEELPGKPASTAQLEVDCVKQVARGT